MGEALITTGGTTYHRMSRILISNGVCLVLHGYLHIALLV